MTDVQAVTMGLSVSACLWKIIDLISGSNYLLVWENTSERRERFQHAVIMLPLLFSNLQVHALNALVYMSAGLKSQLCFDVGEAYNWHFMLNFNSHPCFSTSPPLEQEVCDKGGSAQIEPRPQSRGTDVWQLPHPSICPPGPSTS